MSNQMNIDMEKVAALGEDGYNARWVRMALDVLRQEGLLNEAVTAHDGRDEFERRLPHILKGIKAQTDWNGWEEPYVTDRALAAYDGAPTAMLTAHVYRDEGER